MTRLSIPRQTTTGKVKKVEPAFHFLTRPLSLGLASPRLGNSAITGSLKRVIMYGYRGFVIKIVIMIADYQLKQCTTSCL